MTEKKSIDSKINEDSMIVLSLLLKNKDKGVGYFKFEEEKVLDGIKPLEDREYIERKGEGNLYYITIPKGILYARRILQFAKDQSQ